MSGIVAASTLYEAWMRRRLDVVAADLERKHRAMAKAAFPFMRATFYRFAALWPEACPDLAATPRLLAVGDLHVENFGSWRDAEGRLAWGINDFDEAYPMAYAIDLVRLAASALLAIRENQLAIGGVDACASLLEGYGASIAGGGRGFVLEEMHPALRAMAMGEERDPRRFWEKLGANRTVKPPAAVKKLLRRQLPEIEGKLRIVRRVAGLGSLGRPRYVALGVAQGGMVAREAKAMLPSAFAWAAGLDEGRFWGGDLAGRALRSPDPFYKVKKGWVLRRLGPHCSSIPLGDFPKRRDERRILEAMGRETANVHWGTPDSIAAVRADLKRRKGRWLFEAATRMAEATLADWRVWRRKRH